ncbi:hypothetical protein GGI12_001357 [Dipsacomyces acuminosporus]|nr:hypothetical protein GGI12_001357 [Dipsacomyces acuminosporus]
MKIAVFGGLGALAHAFVIHAVVSDHFVSWYLLPDDELPQDETHSEFLRIVRGHYLDDDNDNDEIGKYQETIRGCDAVFVAFDPSYATNTNAWAQQQLKIQTAMKREGVKRILIITTHGSGDSQRRLDWTTWMQFNANQLTSLLANRFTGINWSLAAHYSAQESVLESGKIIRHEDENEDGDEERDSEWKLEWTIIRPAQLTNGEATGTYLASHDHVFGGFISCADVVDCSLKALEEAMDIGEVFSVAYSARVS